MELIILGVHFGIECTSVCVWNHLFRENFFSINQSEVTVPGLHLEIDPRGVEPVFMKKGGEARTLGVSGGMPPRKF